MLGALFAVSAYRMAAVFGVAALLLYYGWAGPVLVEGIGTLAQAYKTLEQTDAVRIDDSRLKAISAATGSGGLIEIHETRSGKRFVAPPRKTMLKAMEAAGVPIDFGCRRSVRR